MRARGKGGHRRRRSLTVAGRPIRPWLVAGVLAVMIVTGATLGIALSFGGHRSGNKATINKATILAPTSPGPSISEPPSRPAALKKDPCSLLVSTQLATLAAQLSGNDITGAAKATAKPTTSDYQRSCKWALRFKGGSGEGTISLNMLRVANSESCTVASVAGGGTDAVAIPNIGDFAAAGDFDGCARSGDLALFLSYSGTIASDGATARPLSNAAIFSPALRAALAQALPG